MVGLELVLARIARKERLQEESEARYDQKEEHEGYGSRARLDVQARIKPVLLHDHVEQPQKHEAANKDPDDAFDDMTQPEVPQLVCEHRLHLGRCQPRKERIEKYDALRFAEAREVR